MARDSSNSYAAIKKTSNVSFKPPYDSSKSWWIGELLSKIAEFIICIDKTTKVAYEKPNSSKTIVASNISVYDYY